MNEKAEMTIIFELDEVEREMSLSTHLVKLKEREHIDGKAWRFRMAVNGFHLAEEFIYHHPNAEAAVKSYGDIKISELHQDGKKPVVKTSKICRP